MKVCKSCGEIREDNLFQKMGKAGYSAPNCNICRSMRRREVARRNKAQAILYKGGRCNDCESIVHQAAFEFHHIDPSSKANKDPTHFIIDGAKGLTDAAKLELDKCVLLCANCHRVRHFSDLI